MIWPDITYENERALPNGEMRSVENADVVGVNLELLAYYKKMIAIRHAHKALQLGDYKTLLANDAKNIFAFQRQYGNETLWVVINNSDVVQKVQLPRVGFDEFEDLLNDRTYPWKQGDLEIDVPAKQAAVLNAVKIPLNTSAVEKSL